MAKKEYTNKWKYQGNDVDEVPESMIGFVYIITNNVTGKYYVGRKSTTSTTTKPPLKGETKKRKITKESDWRGYWSSSKEVHVDVEKDGQEQFSRVILHWCSSITVLQYQEQYEIFYRDCMISEQSYNSWTDLKLRKCKALIEYGLAQNNKS